MEAWMLGFRTVISPVEAPKLFECLASASFYDEMRKNFLVVLFFLVMK